MIIRRATLGDSEAIVNHLLLAMEEIVYEFIGETNSDKARAFLLHFIREDNNQYSYQNCWVVELDNNNLEQENSEVGQNKMDLAQDDIDSELDSVDGKHDNKVVATVNIYDGGKLEELRRPIVKYIKEHFNKELIVEDETEPGEYYIDSFGVSQNEQGRGLGSKMLQFLIDEYVTRQHKTLGLLVDIENQNAKGLYLKMGFKGVCEGAGKGVGKKTLAGKSMEHLQFKAK